MASTTLSTGATTVSSRMRVWIESTRALAASTCAAARATSSARYPVSSSLSQPLLPSSGQVRRQAGGVFAHAGEREHGLFTLALSRRRETVDTGIEPDVLDGGKVAVQAESLRHVAHAAFDGFGVAAEIDAQHRARAGRRAKDAAQHANQCRFAGAVRSEQPEDVGPPDAERDVVDGQNISEPPGQAVGGNNLSLTLLRRAHSAPNMIATPPIRVGRC